MLGVKEEHRRPLFASLIDAVRDKPILLLLDNFEQVISAAPIISALLAAAPLLRILVTSREVLHLYGEREFAVLPLALHLVNDLSTFWWHLGMRREMQLELERVLAHPHGVGRTAVHASARGNLGTLLGVMGNYTAARSHFGEWLALARELGEIETQARALERLGWVARELDDRVTARARLTESLAIFRSEPYLCATRAVSIAEPPQNQDLGTHTCFEGRSVSIMPTEQRHRRTPH